ncbi:MAG: triose-phosphate isomerase [Bifidobacteriaceae bacterium]|jgi:triosephosphate isomerase|nr:triose-phosphate isomerase [Bifidobacteriaceae bacterium]
MAGRIPLMAGNWKMNLDHTQAIAVVQKLAWALADANHDFSTVEVAVIPPFTDLRSVQTLVDADKFSILYGAQDLSMYDAGAYTGEISGAMLARLGCTYAVVGHSERRQYHGETDEIVGAKAVAAFRHGLVPIICVGEGLDIRSERRHVPYTLAQIDGCFADLDADQAAQAVVAYEPVWAIGTGEVATPADAQEVCGAIRRRLAELYNHQVAGAVRVLYGGSVKSSNVAAIMAQNDVDGALVGGASLDPEEFAKIVRFSDHQVGL